MYKVIDEWQTPDLELIRNEKTFNTIDEAQDYMRACVHVYESTCLEYGSFTRWVCKAIGSAFGYRYETWIEDA